MVKNYHFSQKFVLVMGFTCGSAIKNPPAMQEMLAAQVRSLGWEDPLEKELAIRSSIFA